MKGLVIAIQFLTRLPMPRVSVTGAEFAASIRWFPAVGLIIGILVAAAACLGAWIDPWAGALAALLCWVGITGALHLDGLGDIADAAGAAHKDRERLIAVLADPHVGSFAIVTILLQLLSKLILLRLLIEAQAYVAVALIPFAARIGPLVWTRFVPQLHEGLGALFRDVVRPLDLTLWTALLIGAAILSPSLWIAPFAWLLCSWWLRSRIGGISGDGHGAGIEVTESLLLVAALLWSRLT
ncbi:adenosylcobinamide-GDP ribazoletransferase [Sphingobium lactosutens]|uniref:adenosylcobinamide-GDP ribazoletransferase n=1 Tax=Sphingobium lactosutens TaxID=522773 RepID=UPI0015B8D659|nr:adenosylcobinamide-GDP ribazoletransferase [Sphingobium lactosutens]NWK96414.1 adenosylcobinamide-GDP ribazoletransferase [Sphingobium lactosutens]